MAEVTNELIDEVLPGVQTGVSNIENIQGGMRIKLRAIRGHRNAMQTDIANSYTSADTRGNRVGRKRPELTDAPVN